MFFYFLIRVLQQKFFSRRWNKVTYRTSGRYSGDGTPCTNGRGKAQNKRIFPKYFSDNLRNQRDKKVSGQNI